MPESRELHPVEAARRRTGGQESTLTVVVAMAANASIAVTKAIAGVLTGSAAMLVEAAHSVADRRHPFGYGKVRFFWSLIAAVSIFVTGALFAGFEGVRAILGEHDDETLVWVAFLVLGLSFVMEGVSWTQAVRQIRHELAEEGQQFVEYLRLTDDLTVKTVFLEDTAALIGLLLAFGGVGWIYSPALRCGMGWLRC
jgi:divalent metal cation (Fe/Co/Zn/Cd) transporter